MPLFMHVHAIEAGLQADAAAQAQAADLQTRDGS
jgi:hypothetical protein